MWGWGIRDLFQGRGGGLRVSKVGICVKYRFQAGERQASGCSPRALGAEGQDGVEAEVHSIGGFSPGGEVGKGKLWVKKTPVCRRGPRPGRRLWFGVLKRKQSTKQNEATGSQGGQLPREPWSPASSNLGASGGPG